jgi:hypothetical protein
MQIDGAVVSEQGITFAVVVVKQHVVQARSTANQAIASFAPVFPRMPIVLMGQDGRGSPT